MSERETSLYRIERLELETRDPFTISRGGGSSWPNVLFEAEVDDLIARGEAAPRSYYEETPESVSTALEEWIASTPQGLGDVSPDDIAASGASMAARAALDTAWHDLAAQRSERPLWQELAARYDLEPREMPASSFTIGLADLETIERKTRAAEGWPILKIKLGTDNDLEIVRTVRGATDAELRIDANNAWTAEQTVELAPELDRLGVTMIEQPLPASDTEGYLALSGRCPVPIYIDEACRTLADVERLGDAVDGINLKLSKCGGLYPCVQLLQAARARGIGVMIGCFIESSVAIAAAAALLPFVDHADLDGAALLAEDPFSGLEMESGRLRLPESPGVGVSRR